MTDVVIAGIGQTPVGEHWNLSLRSLAAKTMLAAVKDAAGLRPQALYVGSYLASMVSHQSNLGSLLADNAGFEGIEAYTAEAAGASGGAALRLGWLAVSSGFVGTALVVGVEKFTDQLGPGVEGAIAQAMDSDYEAMQGLTPAAQAGLLMRRYFHEHHPPEHALAAFPLLAHANAVHNPNAYFRKAIERSAYERAEMVCDPLNLYDAAPYADGAAAVVLTRPQNLPAGLNHAAVRITGSSVIIDTLALHDRPDVLAFDAARISVERACRQAGMLPADADLFELCDAFSIYAALSLEAAGLAMHGQAWQAAAAGEFGPGGRLPINTLGGFKGRGNPLGAAGLYQVVEACQQLRGEAGGAQVKGARRALVQCLGGPASTAAAHVLEV